MHFILNHLSSLKVGRPTRFRFVFCLGLILIAGFVSDNVSGQDRGQPHNFGDTPSPTEMMARLKYHKQQETPLFDLLREAGVDIFSKLSDDEKKLAGRFVEDMILKEGIDSEKISSLMDKMNIGSEARQALREGIERAGVDESAISPEQRKELANKIRKDFLQRSGSETDLFKSPTNRNLQQPERPRDLAAGQDREAINNRRQEFGSGSGETTDRNRNPAPNTRANELARQQELRRQAEEQRRRTARNDNQGGRAPSNQTRPQSGNSNQSQADREAFDRLNRAGRELGRGVANNPRNRQPQTASSNPTNTEPPADDRDSQDGSNSIANSLQRQIAKQAAKQLESEFSESEKKVFSEFKNKIQRGDFSSDEIGELVRNLQEPASTKGFALQLDKAGQKFGLPIESRKEIFEAYSGLSSDEKRSLQRKLKEIDADLLAQLADNTNVRGVNDPASRPPQDTATRPVPSPAFSEEFVSEQFDNLENEQLGKDFLKDALDTYNNADSGYELSPAFKQLKDRAEGKVSDRQMANLGNISKELFDGTTDIFDPDSDAIPRRPDGVKPGQRLDQLLAAAANKALASEDPADGENKSLLSDALNNALGVALDQAVTIADKNKANRDSDLLSDSSQRTQPFPNNSSLQNQLNSFQDFNNTPFDTASSNSSISTSSSNENSIESAAASIADSVSQMNFDAKNWLYAVGLIGLLALAVFFLFRLFPVADVNALKQRELQRKLQDKSANPRDVVEAVDLFLLSRFGDASSWWNAQHAADQITTSKPDWRDRVVSLFQVYRWSRYQADGNASVSAEQNELVNSTLQELSQAPDDSFNATASSAAPKSAPDQSDDVHDGATS